MPINEPFAKGALQQFILEWRVEGALDGTTIAPGLARAANVVVQQPLPPEQPYVIPVPGGAGLFSPDGLGTDAVVADRYLQWIRVQPAVFPVPAGFRVRIVDASGLVPAAGLITVFNTLLSGPFDGPAFYASEFDFVPQGAVVQIFGIAAPPPGLSHSVQFGVRGAVTAKDDAELTQASCCLSGERPVAPGGIEAELAD